MIRNFKNKTTQDIYDDVKSRQARDIPLVLHDKARRLLDQINAITDIKTLRIPPSNRLEKLTGNLKGYWSLRLNKQWRIVFKWENNDAHDVNITDYH